MNRHAGPSSGRYAVRGGSGRSAHVAAAAALARATLPAVSRPAPTPDVDSGWSARCRGRPDTTARCASAWLRPTHSAAGPNRLAAYDAACPPSRRLSSGRAVACWPHVRPARRSVRRARAHPSPALLSRRAGWGGRLVSAARYRAVAGRADGGRRPVRSASWLPAVVPAYRPARAGSGGPSSPATALRRGSGTHRRPWPSGSRSAARRSSHSRPWRAPGTPSSSSVSSPWPSPGRASRLRSRRSCGRG